MSKIDKKDMYESLKKDKIKDIKQGLGEMVRPVKDYKELYKFTKIVMMYAWFSAILFGFSVNANYKMVFFTISVIIFLFMFSQVNKIEHKIKLRELEESKNK